MTKRSQFERVKAGLCRREFLHYCGVCAGVVALPPGWMKLLAAAQANACGSHKQAVPASGLPFHFFDPAQAATVEAVTDQIIPADQDPGAKWAGVVHYIDLALAGDLRHCRPVYTNGLKRLEAVAHTLAGKMFVDLQFADQTRVLEQLEQDRSLAAGTGNGADFFELVRRHTLEGFFGDPKYGGNRESVSWKILKFEA